MNENASLLWRSPISSWSMELVVSCSPPPNDTISVLRYWLEGPLQKHQLIRLSFWQKTRFRVDFHSVGDATERKWCVAEVESDQACQADLVKHQNNDFPGSGRQQMSANGRVLTGSGPNLAAFYPEQNVKVGTMLYSSVINISEALCRIRVTRWLQAAACHLLSCGKKGDRWK